MQPSNAKKRRLEALAQQQQMGGRPRQATQRKSPAAATPPTVPSGTTEPGATEEGGPPQYPYLPLELNQQLTTHIASRLQLPGQTACKGNVEDALTALMSPHMPLPVAQSMIAARAAADKAVVLLNPTGRVNLAKPSGSSKAQRQQWAGKLLPRAQRGQLAALPKSGIDYAAMMSLHECWCTYVSGVLSKATTADACARLLQTLDWHGALVRVVACKNPIYEHRVGIVAKATLNTFVIVSDDGRSSIVPLKGSAFECSVDCGGRVLHLRLAGDTLKTLQCEQVPG